MPNYKEQLIIDAWQRRRLDTYQIAREVLGNACLEHFVVRVLHDYLDEKADARCSNTPKW